MSKRISGIFKGDKVIWMVFFFLCIISAVEVFSALSSLTYKTGDYISTLACVRLDAVAVKALRTGERTYNNIYALTNQLNTNLS